MKLDTLSCLLYTKNSTIQYAGANHPLYLVRNDEVLVYEGDRMPIGLYHEHFKFSAKEFKYQEKDIIYSSTDGIVDQFGGSTLKKFKSKKFKQLLVDNSNLEMEDQKKQIVNAFYNWKGSIEQIDDILVFGLRF